MERQDKINTLLSVIQSDDTKLLVLLRIVIANNINNVSDIQLDTMLAILGISNDVG